jgi:hypothetical protein
MGCVVQLPDGVLRLFMKGASEILTRKMRYVIKSRPLTGHWQVDDDLATDLTLIGITGIENPLRGVQEAVSNLKTPASV